MGTGPVTNARHTARVDTVVRLLHLLALLQGEAHTGEVLASSLGVTLRTVRRDIGRLREAGFAVDATPGAYGGYRLVGGSRMPPLTVTDDEALALAIALRGPSAATVAGLDGSAPTNMLAKLERLLPPDAKRQVADLREATVSSLRTPPAPAMVGDLVRLARGCRECQQVEFAYSSPRATQPSTKRVEPFRLVQTSHCWYLVARDLHVTAWRSYRVDRMRDVKVTPQTFVRFDPPDAERFVTEGMAVAVYEQRATIDVPAPMEEVVSAVPHSYGVVDRLDGQRSRITVGFEDQRWLVQFIANLPWDATVVDPPWLSDALADLGRRLVAAHADQPVRAPASAPA